MSVSDQTPVRIGLLGIGTVGGGTYEVLTRNQDEITRRVGRPLAITRVADLDLDLARRLTGPEVDVTNDASSVVGDPDIDIVIELIGGYGIAKTLTLEAIAHGKHVVTANKALLAVHGNEIFQAALAKNVIVAFEAAVGGGIPIIKALREGLVANRIEWIAGIINGTTNFILSEMRSRGVDFAAALADAQANGYAEADPTFDIEGVDAAHKLAILAGIAFGGRIDFGAMEIRGITRIRAADIAQARALGYVIRLVGLAECEPDTGELFQRVQPCLVPRDHPLAAVDGPTNAVVLEGNFSGRLLFQGAGAGDGPTASAVVADLIDIARGDTGMPFSVPVAELERIQPADTGRRRARSYLRFTVTDRPGVLAEITAAMRDAGVSIESLIQQGRPEEGGEVLVAMVTHDGPESGVAHALNLLLGSPSLTAPPLVMPLLD